MAAEKKSARKKSLPKKQEDTKPIETQPVEIAPQAINETGDSTQTNQLETYLRNPIYQRGGMLAVIALILGWLSDFLFWKEDFGVNFSVFLIVCLAAGVYWLSSNGLKPSKNSLWLLIPFLFFAVFSFIRKEPMTVFLDITFALFCAGIFATSYISGKWFEYGFSDYFQRFFVLLWDLVSAPINYFPRARRVQLELDNGNNKLPIWGLLRGLLIALPIVICFGSLLAAGDAVFENKLNDFFDFENFDDNLFRTIAVLFYAYITAGTFLHSATQSGKTPKGANETWLKPFLGFAETSVILASVSVLFLSFVVVQFQYFFGGEKNIGVAGLTYSAYARSGFNELVTVAFFSLLLIMGLGRIAKRETSTQKNIYSWLGAFIACEVLVILASAYQRLSLAIDWHGFSRLRLYPNVFLIWVGILFITVVFLEILHKEHHFTLAFALAAMGFSATLTVINVDAAIIQRNITRVENGKHFNPGHLASLSEDAIPGLVQYYRSPDISEETRTRIGAVLLCYINADEIKLAHKRDWQSFNYAEWEAANLLNEVKPLLTNYKSSGYKWNLYVVDQNNVRYECKGIY
jgi:hypothetical protein